MGRLLAATPRSARALVVRAAAEAGAGSAAAVVAELKEALETRLAGVPEDVDTRVALGELYLGIGLASSARDHLYAASLVPPRSWQAYQRLQALLRRAEMHAQHAFPRPPGAAPPLIGRRGADIQGER